MKMMTVSIILPPHLQKPMLLKLNLKTAVITNNTFKQKQILMPMQQKVILYLPMLKDILPQKPILLMTALFMKKKSLILRLTGPGEIHHQ
jgi:hypothetical protein